MIRKTVAVSILALCAGFATLPVAFAAEGDAMMHHDTMKKHAKKGKMMHHEMMKKGEAPQDQPAPQ